MRQLKTPQTRTPKHGRPPWARIAVMPVARALLLIHASASLAQPATFPAYGHVAGGIRVETQYFSEFYDVIPYVYFGETYCRQIAKGDLVCTGGPTPICMGNYVLTVPPNATAGPVVVTFYVPGFSSFYYEPGFTYYDKPVVTQVSPSRFSYLPDSRRATVEARGIDVTGPVQVFFGDQAATAIEVQSNGLYVTCSPPLFPGDSIPLKVDVRVVNQDGGDGVLVNGFEYGRVSPIVNGAFPYARAWTIGEVAIAYVSDLIPGDIRLYVDGVPASIKNIVYDATSQITFVVPPRAPGLVSITVVNGDGGTRTAPGIYRYIGTLSTDIHPGDLDRDFRFNLSEVLRTVQFYSFPGFHCDSETEDGYAPGAEGDHACAPYPTDNDPLDWQIGLTELLQIIQFYNLHCYQPCPGAPGTYCPPN